MSETRVYLNGKIIPADEATLSVSDAGFLHGSSVFTTLRSHNGRAFRLDRHVGRLLATADKFGLRHGAGVEALTAAVAAVLAANALAEARIRITLSPGPIAAEENPTTLVTASPLEQCPWWYDDGVTVTRSPFGQFAGDPTVGVKTGCYLSRVLARRAAAAAGAEEALWFTPDGRLAEACFCNVFLVKDAQVHTPPEDTPVLPGVVRQAVIELCGKLSIPCRCDKPLSSRDVLDAREMFLTSSTAGVRPAVRIDRRPVGQEKPGPVTKKIMAAYERLLEEECGPAAPD